MRPAELSTLEAIDLTNGQTLANALAAGAKHLHGQSWHSPAELVKMLYHDAVGRDPNEQELVALVERLGEPVTDEGLQDVLWALVMLPEFQLVR